MGTATPQAATSGARQMLILSPTRRRVLVDLCSPHTAEREYPPGVQHALGQPLGLSLGKPRKKQAISQALIS